MTPFSGPSQRSCESWHQLAPQAAEVGEDRLDLAADDVLGQRSDRGHLDVVAAADGEDEAVPFVPVLGVRGQQHVRRGVVGVRVHGVGPVEGAGRGEAHVVRLQPGEAGHGDLSVGVRRTIDI
jgi:hypothetical protein